MNLAIINTKGGQGKTHIAANLVLDLDFYYFSTDWSILEEKFPDHARIVDKLELYENANVIYDFPGFIDQHNFNIIKDCDLIIIPFIENDENSVKKTEILIEDIKKQTKKKNTDIILIQNYSSGNAVFNDFETYHLKESKVFGNTLKNKTSVLQYCKQSKINQHQLRNFIGEYKKLIKRIKKCQ